MAIFDIEQAEGTRWIKITMVNETVVAERGVLSHLRGDIKMKGRIPGPIRLLRAAISGEEAFRPTFTGTGTPYTESTLGGFHVLELDDSQTWVVESGAFWASEARVHQTFARERIMTSLRTGEGIFDFQTRVSGHGKVMLHAPGPVEEVVLSKESNNQGRLVADGKQVLARTAGIKYTAALPGWMPWSRATTGEKVLRTYEGEGRLLISTTPYWRYMVAQQRQGQGPADDLMM